MKKVKITKHFDQTILLMPAKWLTKQNTRKKGAIGMSYTFADIVDLAWENESFETETEAIEAGKKMFPEGFAVGKINEKTNKVDNLGQWLIYECDECGEIYETYDPDYIYCNSESCEDKDIKLTRRHEL